MDPDKRGMSDYNGEMRRGGRGGGGGYRMPGSKDMAPGDMGHYGDKVCWQLAIEATRLRLLSIGSMEWNSVYFIRSSRLR